MWEFTFPASPDVLRAATYLVSRNTALVFRYRGSGRTATTGEVFLVRAVSRGKRKLTAVCSHQTRIGNLDAHLI
ncbi:hypothetical protein EWT20_08015 [Escherichia coli O25b:H4]|nr:hypothetical protein EWT20_08015 [Escherichia coli O25b:H4]